MSKTCSTSLDEIIDRAEEQIRDMYLSKQILTWGEFARAWLDLVSEHMLLCESCKAMYQWVANYTKSLPNELFDERPELISEINIYDLFLHMRTLKNTFLPYSSEFSEGEEKQIKVTKADVVKHLAQITGLSEERITQEMADMELWMKAIAKDYNPREARRHHPENDDEWEPPQPPMASV